MRIVADNDEEIIEKAASLDDRAVLAGQSKDETDGLIKDFMPFLHSRVAIYNDRAGDEQQHEEMVSTAMLAFYESIQSYDKEKGHFFPFASSVINKRLIDHIRSIYKHKDKTIPLEEEGDGPESEQTAAIDDISVRLYEEKSRQELLVYEIEQFKSELDTWGITMESLSRQSPKHMALRDTYRTAVKQVSLIPDIVQTIQLKRYFPIKAISKITGLPQKKLERARTFILASLIIKIGDYDMLADYVDDRR